MLTVICKKTVHIIKAIASPMTCCCRPDRAEIRFCFRSATSSMGVW